MRLEKSTTGYYSYNVMDDNECIAVVDIKVHCNNNLNRAMIEQSIAGAVNKLNDEAIECLEKR